MTAKHITAWILVSVGLIAGCGQKGPLYQEAAPQTEAAGAAEPKDAGNRNDDGSEG